jgi:hypothetical protein
MDTTTAYAEIVKAERNAEGDLVVVGKATGPDLDLDQQICDPEWLKSAMPAWMSSGGNIREQHSSIAAGVATELEQRGDAWMVTATVVDPVSARKVEKGVLKGFSIGIRSPRVVKDVSAPGGRIVGGSIVETSLVDRPANPTCTLVLAKMAKPGPGQAAEVSKGLVHVEELHDHAGDQLAELQKSIRGFDLFAVRKGDTAGQVTDLRQAVALIGGVIAADAAALADGSPTAAVDIDTLTGAAKALGWIIQQEEAPAVAHTDQDAPTTGPDATKAADELAKGKKPAFLDDDTESDEDEDDADEDKPKKKKATDKAATPETPDLTELVKAAVAEAIAPLQERLAKAEAAPQAGGPVLTRTVQDIQKASNREAVLAEAERLQATADALTGESRASYLAKAAELRRQAATS